MKLRKNIGIILMMMGVFLTVNQSVESHDLVKQIGMLLKRYWPLLLSFYGIYMISTPKKRK